jgi:hypothetical protein
MKAGRKVFVRPTPNAVLAGYRERLVHEEKVQPMLRKEAEVMFLPQLGGGRQQEEEHLDGVFRYYGRRKMNLFSDDNVCSSRNAHPLMVPNLLFLLCAGALADERWISYKARGTGG